jgi:hypothetical protein
MYGMAYLSTFTYTPGCVSGENWANIPGVEREGFPVL